MLIFDPIIQQGLFERIKWNINSDCDFQLAQFEKIILEESNQCSTKKDRIDLYQKYYSDLRQKIDTYTWSEWVEVEYYLKDKINKTMTSQNKVEEFSLDNSSASKMLLKINNNLTSKVDEYEILLGRSKKEQLDSLIENVLSSLDKLITDQLKNFNTILYKDLPYLSLDLFTEELHGLQGKLKSPHISNEIIKYFKSEKRPLLKIIYDLLNEVSNTVRYIITEGNRKKWDLFVDFIFSQEEYNGILDFYLLQNKKQILENLDIPKQENKNISAKGENSYGIQWTGDPSKINVLFDELVNNKLIEPINGSERLFVDFFTSTIKSTKSFKWKSDQNIIAYLFESLMYNDLIERYAEYNSIIRDSFFFVTSNEMPIKNLKELKHQYEYSKTGHPRKSSLIDSIIQKITSNT